MSDQSRNLGFGDIAKGFMTWASPGYRQYRIASEENQRKLLQAEIDRQAELAATQRSEDFERSLVERRADLANQRLIDQENRALALQQRALPSVYMPTPGGGAPAAQANLTPNVPVNPTPSLLDTGTGRTEDEMITSALGGVPVNNVPREGLTPLVSEADVIASATGREIPVLNDGLGAFDSSVPRNGDATGLASTTQQPTYRAALETLLTNRGYITPEQRASMSPAAREAIERQARADSGTLTALEREATPEAQLEQAEETARMKQRIDVETAQMVVDLEADRETLSWVEKWETNDAPRAAQDLTQIAQAIRKLENNPNLTGPVAQLFYGPNPVQKFILSDEAKAVETTFGAIASRDLRDQLGAQFTENEGKRLLAYVFDPSATPQENIRRAQVLFNQIKSVYDNRNSKLEYLRANRSLKGYESRVESIGTLEQLEGRMDAELLGITQEESAEMHKNLREFYSEQERSNMTPEEYLERKNQMLTFMRDRQ